MPIPPSIARGHETPFIRQFNVFLPNRVGQLFELLTLLERSAVEVRGLTIIDSSGWAVVRMVVSDPGKAREVFARHGVASTENDLLAVVVEEPTTLRSVCETLIAAEVSVHFVYPLMICHEGRSVVALGVEDIVLAAGLLRKHGFRVLESEGPSAAEPPAEPV